MVMPAETPYDRELLGDHVGALIRRYGAVRLSSGHCAWWLTMTEGAGAAQCGLCLRPVECGVRHTDGDLMCIDCISRRVIATQVECTPSAA